MSITSTARPDDSALLAFDVLYNDVLARGGGEAHASTFINMHLWEVSFGP